ncbi:MAG: hypothetical protein ABI895_19065 [Deltaproteobacteria bacterium]
MQSGLIAVLMASCGRFGYDPLWLDATGDASIPGQAGSASGGASGADANDAGLGTDEPDTGGAGGLMSVDSGIPSPSGSGASGAAGAGADPFPDGGSDPDPSCFDGLQNQGETGLDCGGSFCGPCASCSDGLQNQGETGLDCGGAFCGPCASCFDGLQNQGETGLDCGGSFCGPCASCSDGLQNQGETGLDCGGSFCAPCPCTFGAPQVLGNPNGGGNSLWAPTLSSNGLTMYMSLTASGFNEQIAVATRSIGGNFNVPTTLPSPVNSFIEGTPELSEDGLSLYFFSEGFGGAATRDLYVAKRASPAVQFNTVSELTTINSTARDDRPWVSPDELTIYFSSQRASSSDDLWRATRTTPSNAFGTPVAVTELNSAGNDAGIFLTADGLVALFGSDRSGSSGVDIYRATRASTSTPFSTPQRVSALNSSADDFDPQLTADGQELFFASTRSTGTYRIWRSVVTCP